MHRPSCTRDLANRAPSSWRGSAWRLIWYCKPVRPWHPSDSALLSHFRPGSLDQGRTRCRQPRNSDYSCIARCDCTTVFLEAYSQTFVRCCTVSRSISRVRGVCLFGRTFHSLRPKPLHILYTIGYTFLLHGACTPAPPAAPVSIFCRLNSTFRWYPFHISATIVISWLWLLISATERFSSWSASLSRSTFLMIRSSNNVWRSSYVSKGNAHRGSQWPAPWWSVLRRVVSRGGKTT